MTGAKQDPSFGWLVFRKAVSDTIQFLEYTTRDIVLGAITLIMGGALAYFFVGRADTVKEFAFIAAFTLAPAGIVMSFVFLWHLWLAPAAIAYEAAKTMSQAVARSPAAAEVRKPQVNWAIWKHLNEYTVQEFSSILAQRDPEAGGGSNEEFTFRRLMVQDIDDDNLEFEKRKLDSLGKTSQSTVLNRNEAMKWAKKHGFNVSHIA
ncbi:MAG TPA: hypothetical protein VJ476_04395 [Rhizomicrobium sp.]|nr:hypothetical protein [Rhizomicrobium sp.]